MRIRHFLAWSYLLQAYDPDIWMATKQEARFIGFYYTPINTRGNLCYTECCDQIAAFSIHIPELSGWNLVWQPGYLDMSLSPSRWLPEINLDIATSFHISFN
jgi:hypothetical protein